MPANARFAVPPLVALTAAAAILAAVYPGFMSYDSVRALHEARTAVQGGDYPPFVSYVWRVFDAVWPGPALMLFAQNFLLLLSFATILRLLRYPGPLIVLGVALFCAAPPILGPMLVVWKDIGVSACLCAAVACWLVADSVPKARLAIATGIVLLFAAAAYRLNAITSIVPLVAWYSWRRGFADFARGTALVCGAAIFAGIALAVAVVDGYQLPSFQPLPRPAGIKNVMVHDLVAMSALTGNSLVPKTMPPSNQDDQIEYFRRIYDPRHVGLVLAKDREGRIEKFLEASDSVVRSTFFTAVRAEPAAYFQHRAAVFRELVGFTNEGTYNPSHFAVDPNEEGVTHQPTRLSRRVTDYIRDESSKLPGKPWLYYAVGVGILPLVFLRHGARVRGAAIAVAASGVLYLLPLYFVTPSAEVRYNHWSVVCALLVAAMALAPRGVRVDREVRPHSTPRCVQT